MLSRRAPTRPRNGNSCQWNTCLPLLVVSNFKHSPNRTIPPHSLKTCLSTLCGFNGAGSISMSVSRFDLADSRTPSCHAFQSGSGLTERCARSPTVTYCQNRNPETHRDSPFPSNTRLIHAWSAGPFVSSVGRARTNSKQCDLRIVSQHLRTAQKGPAC